MCSKCYKEKFLALGFRIEHKMKISERETCVQIFKIADRFNILEPINNSRKLIIGHNRLHLLTCFRFQ